MSSKVGNVSFYDPTRKVPLQNHSVKKQERSLMKKYAIIDEAYQRTLSLLKEKERSRDFGKELLDKEVLHKSDVEILIENDL